ncbi:MAG: hypothetical protein IKR18_01205 [Bacteroidaceae bacterium]|nr:hypothetical protein [Bacteroidaceae bacterium]
MNLINLSFMLLCLLSGMTNGKTLIVRKAPSGISLPHVVTSNSFEYEMPYKEYQIADSLLVDKVYSEILLEKEKTDTLTGNFQITHKLLLVDSGKVESIVCLGSSSLIHDGIFKECSDGLVKWLDEMTESLPAEETAESGSSGLCKRQGY